MTYPSEGVLFLVFAIILICIILLAYLLYDASRLRTENTNLKAQVNTLMGLLQNYFAVERENAVSPQRERNLNIILDKLNALSNGGISIKDSDVSVGRDMTGGNSGR